VAVTGKPRTYETDDGGVNVSLRAEAITPVDESTRRRWVVETADLTIERIQRYDDPGNRFAEMAQEHYDGSLERFQEMVIRSLESLIEE
jgi:RPA family protein